MKIAVVCSHVGSHGIQLSGQHGGGELFTFAVLKALDEFYDVTAIIPNGVYPAFDAADDYGLDLHGLKWKPMGDKLDWIRSFDVMLAINHDWLPPPICRRNILARFFPQHPEWDVSGYDTFIAISQFTADWIKRYQGVEADVVYPPVPIQDIQPVQWDRKEKAILCIGRFFDVPSGNNKNHVVVVNAFKDLMLPDWQLHMIGAVQHEDYYRTVREASGNDRRVVFHHNIQRKEYISLLQRAKFIWAATGYQAEKPSSREHYGIFAVEGMAAGCVPIVHNSGGTPEVGCLVWDELHELIDQARQLIGSDEVGNALSRQMVEKAQEFSFVPQARRLVEVIEKPVVLYHHPEKARIYVSAPPPQEIKVAMLSDSPTITTGFGVVTRMLGAGLKTLGYNLVSFALQDPLINPALDYANDPWRIMRGCTHDTCNWTHFNDFFAQEKPDVVYMNYDLGNIRAMLDRMRALNCDAPIIAYFPVEGAPVIDQYIETLRLLRLMNGYPLCYTKWAVEAIKACGGPVCDWHSHGCNHANFHKLPRAERDKLRFAVGWQDKWVCGFGGRNKRTKGFSTLLETARILKEAKAPVVWYLHTDPNDCVPNSSQPLLQMVHQMYLDDVVFFPPDLDRQTHGIPYDEPPFRGSVPDTDDIRKVHEWNMRTMSMIERYGLLDMYVNLSEAEGFGLMSLEAMGCGVPVLSVDDQGVQREVLGNAPAYVPVAHWDTWHTGAKLAQVDPQKVAKAIMELMYNPKELADMSQQGLAQYAKYKWSDLAMKIHKIIQDVVA